MNENHQNQPTHDYSDLASRIITCSNDGVVICEAEPNVSKEGLRIVYVNEAFVRETGYTADEVIGKTPRILQGPDTDLATLARIRNALQAWQPIREELLNYKKNGEEFWQSLNIFAVSDKNGWFTHWVAIQHNITVRKKLELNLQLAKVALQLSEERYRKVLEDQSDIIFRFNANTNILFVNPALCHLFGKSPSELLGTSWHLLCHPEDLPLIKHAQGKISPLHATCRLECRVIRSDGSIRRFDFLSRLFFDLEGSFLEGQIEGRDITEYHLATEQLRKLSLTVEQSPESIIITNLDAEIEYVNKAFVQTTGFTREEVQGKNPSILRSSTTPSDTFQALWQNLTQGQSWQGEWCNTRKDGSKYIEYAMVNPIRDAQDNITHYVGIQTDISDRKRAEAQALHFAFYDQLTNLPNRRLVLDRLQQALPKSARKHECGALIFIDLDNFKVLNDTLGHSVGDELLRQVSTRLTACVRSSDTVARLGGDEFLVLLEGLSNTIATSGPQASVVGNKILAAMAEPFILGDCNFNCTVSMGVTLFFGQDDNVDELLKHADLAMYQAKACGRNQMRFFDTEMQKAMHRRSDLENDIRHGLKQHWFSLFYQPQVNTIGRIIGAEALLRLQHPQRGLLYPAEFISLAEQTGQILELGCWVLNAACDQLVFWSKHPATSDLRLSINVSARQFHQTDFVEQVRAALNRSGAHPDRLKIELTESVLIDDLAGTIFKIETLRNIGVRFSLDDFGTGYSSLSYLRRLPLDQIKIDKSFVRDLPGDPDACAIVKTIIALAKTLNLGIIAEGVETQIQQDFLENNHCNNFQGYLYSRPLPCDAFMKLMSTKQLAGFV